MVLFLTDATHERFRPLERAASGRVGSRRKSCIAEVPREEHLYKVGFGLVYGKLLC